ncbi:hypothetical protein [Proteus mirabilis]|uniref:hypothetical protein n=1 Tax=Proteus mirabilis TaxID=584 RepID=UPI0034D5ACD3
MNERDWVDLVVAGSSVLSSLGILATIGVYFWQKNDKNKNNDRIKNALIIELEMISSQFKELIEIKNSHSNNTLILSKINNGVSISRDNGKLIHLKKIDKNRIELYLSKILEFDFESSKKIITLIDMLPFLNKIIENIINFMEDDVSFDYNEESLSKMILSFNELRMLNIVIKIIDSIK